MIYSFLDICQNKENHVKQNILLILYT